MDATEEVLEAARRRAVALTAGDAATLRALLHPEFRWVSHTGERFDRDSYVASNTSGATRWVGQQLLDVEVVLHAQTAVLRCQVVDEVDTGTGPQELRLSMTQVWVRRDGGWVCLVGHAGPALTPAA